MMTQSQALRILDAGQSALLSGPAGSGKTHVLRAFIKRVRAQGKRVAVTATTGLAATHLDGSTIHAWSGIGIHDVLPPRYHESLSQSRRDTIRSTDVLVIDEISMLHDYRLDLVDEIAREVREIDQPFGGIQVVLCGDFFQLPPVNRAGSRQGGFVVRSRAWAALNPTICYLSSQHRQDDEAFLGILNALRAGELTEDHVALLQDRMHAELADAERLTELYTTNVDVDRLNATELAQLPGIERRFRMETTGKANYVETLKRSCLAQEELALKEGATVMCLRNAQNGQYVNGSLGIVEGFDPDTGHPIVALRNGRTLIIGPDTWELKDGDTRRAQLMQIPLRLAWAITVHKSQGMTLDAARIDLGRAFVEGMGYVALSRVRRLDTLCLTGLNPMALRVSADAQAIDAELHRLSDEAGQRFADLAELEDVAPRPVTKESSWHERLADMRATHPNAFKPWRAEDDAQLKAAFLDGDGLAVLTERFGRQPGSIRARLQKHFGEDVTIPK